MGILDKAGIEKIKIIDCKEELEILSPNEFNLSPMYFRWGFSDSEVIQLRSGIVKRLRKAKKNLNKGWNFKIWDGYRTIYTQGLLYKDYKKKLEKENPDWSYEKTKKNVEIFVSFPSKEPLLPAPHNTGGAVDLTLVDEHGNDIQMGTDFDEFNIKSYTEHYSDKNGIKAIFHKNRMTLKNILEDVGFVNYHEEWWHFSYGDQEWARQNGLNKAVYGSMEV